MTSNNTSSVCMSKLSRYVSNITGSAAYRHNVREDLKAITDNKGIVQFFFSFSAADMHWPELYSLFKTQADQLANEE